MADSIRTEIAVESPGNCPIARESNTASAAITGVTRSSGATSEGMITEEFRIEGDIDSTSSLTFESIFKHEDKTVYRFERESERNCVCDYIEQYGCVVNNIYAANGVLYLSFFAPDIDQLQSILSAIRDSFGDVTVRQLLDSDLETTQKPVFVDRNRLTDRQLEVLETSYEMGYFEYPKRANASEVAAALEIAPSTFSEHLAAAQRKFLQTILEA